MADAEENNKAAARNDEESSVDDGSPPRKKSYKILSEKTELVLKAECLVRAEKVMSLHAFAQMHDVQPSQIRRKEKNLMKMKHTLDSTKRKKAKKACMPCKPSRLDKIKDHLLPWIDLLRLVGKSVSVQMVTVWAKWYDTSLRQLRRYTLFAIVRRFLTSNGVVLRATMHKSQEDPKTKVELAKYFWIRRDPYSCSRIVQKHSLLTWIKLHTRLQTVIPRLLTKGALKLWQQR